MNTLQVIGRAAVLALPLLTTACKSYLDVDQAVAMAELPATAAEFAAGPNLTNTAPEQQWWAQLQDAQLDALMQDALGHNHDIRIARAALEESRALLRQSRTNRLPTLDAGTGVQREKIPTSVNPLRPTAITETYQAGFDTSWEVDLFTGRLGNAVKQGRAQQAQREADLQGVQVSIAAEVASAYISLRGSQYLLQVAENNAAVQQQTYELTQTLDEVGQGDVFDVSRAQAQLALTEARLPSLRADIELALNRLAVLTGKGREQLGDSLASVQSLPSMPASIAVGSPQTLLQRRPDIRSAEAELQGAVAQYNIAVSDLYPRIVLSGSFGYLASDWSSLDRSSSETFSFAPMLQWGGLNQGRAQARIAAADARTRARVAAFEQRVLQALEETGNALQQFSQEEQRRLKLLEAAQASSMAAEFARERFEIGSSDFLSVLDAQRSQLEVDAQLAQSETQLLLNLVAVYKALGGGWETQQQ